MPAALILRLARTSRWAIVGSGTRNARAISAVVRPPSVRSVSATCASVASAGWQQVKISSSRSSGNVVVVHLVLHGLGHLEQPRLLRQRPVAADAVDRAVARRSSIEPRARVVRHAVARPALRRDRERLLRGLLGEVEVAEEADQRGEDAPPLRRGRPARGSATTPRSGAPRSRRPAAPRGSCAASSIAASRSSASKKQVAADAPP